MAIILSNLKQLKKSLSLEDSLENLLLNGLLKIPPHIAYVATLPCETLTAAKQAIGDTLQCSVATYFRCGGAVNQTRKGLLLSLSVKKFSNR